jgi:streptogramin lyase
VLVLIVCLVVTCRKKDKEDDCPLCPSVESLSPVSAKCYEKLTISGRNFNVKTKENIVKINGVQIDADSILSGTETQLVVKVPRGCGTGPVTVDVDVELTHVGDAPTFNYIYRYEFADFGIPAANPPSCIGGIKSNISNYIDPTGIVVDAFNNIYFTDQSHHCVFKLEGGTRDSCLFAGFPGNEGGTDGSGTQASFRYPGQMYINSSNTIYVSENSTSIRAISPSGTVSTYITDTNLNYTTGIAFQPGTEIAYASVLGDHIITKIERKNGKLVASIFAGARGQGGYVDGIGTAARFLNPQAIVVDNAGNVFVSDENNVIRKITPSGVVSTLAGSGSPLFEDGLGKKASFNKPMGMFIDSDNSIYVADHNNNAIRKITPDGNVTTFFTFTAKMNAPFPRGIAKDKSDNFFVTVTSNVGNGIKKLAKY